MKETVIFTINRIFGFCFLFNSPNCILLLDGVDRQAALSLPKSFSAALTKKLGSFYRTKPVLCCF